MPIIQSSYITGGSSGLSNGKNVAFSPVTAQLPASAVAYPAASGGASFASECGGLSGAPLDILAALTDGGRNLIARSLIEGLGFRVIGFRVGTGGYNNTNVLAPTALNGADTELINPLYPIPTTSPKAIDRYEYPNSSAISFLCRVPSGAAIAGLGEIGLYADILYSPSDPTEVGDRYLFAHCHRPLMGKTLQDVLVYRIVVQYTLA